MPDSIYLARDGKKRCSKCHETKDVKDFYKNKARKDGYNHYCKLCANAATKESVASRKQLEQTRLVRRTQDAILRDRFGVPLHMVEQLVWEQNNKCPICHNEMDTPMPDLDSAGLVRAMLCSTCFTGLTMFRGDGEILERAISYLNSFKTDELLAVKDESQE